MCVLMICCVISRFSVTMQFYNACDPIHYELWRFYMK